MENCECKFAVKDKKGIKWCFKPKRVKCPKGNKRS